MPRVLLFGKTADPYFRQAVSVAERETDLTVHAGSRDEAFPAAAVSWTGEYVISYLSPWILPTSLLKRATKAAINLHPGPPAYPGIGCTNFALYNDERTYGITCHRMAPLVDTGPIIAVRRFPILGQETVLSLTQRCHAAIFVLFGELLALIAVGEPLPAAGETWTRRPYRRAELDALCRVTLDMPDDEVRRRIRATTYPNMPGPFVEIDGERHPIADLGDLERIRASTARVRPRR